MKTDFVKDKYSPKPIYHQLANYIADQIIGTNVPTGTPLMSVNDAYKAYGVSRDTLIAAYKLLQRRLLVTSAPGKGFFVFRKQDKERKNLFVLFDAMNQYKETLYRSFVDNLDDQYEISTAFHYYNKDLFDTLISTALGHFDYYVVIPHFNEDITDILNKLPADRLLLLDAFPDGYSRNCAAVYQDFRRDAYEGLKSILDKLRRYDALHIVYNDKFQYMPNGYLEGAYRFAGEFHIPVYIEPGFDVDDIQKGHCYLAVSERDLATIINSITNKGLVAGENIGLLSLDETPLKEVLIGGITTLTTDFRLMGRTAAKLIKQGKKERIANPIKVFVRGNL